MNECGKEKEEGGGLVERGMEFLDGVGWMDFAEREGGVRGAGLVSPD